MQQDLVLYIMGYQGESLFSFRWGGVFIHTIESKWTSIGGGCISVGVPELGASSYFVT